MADMSIPTQDPQRHAPLNIFVLAGGISHERDVSLRSGRRVAELLSKQGHVVQLREPNGDILRAESQPDAYWLSLHGASGEDGSLISLLERTGAVFVGTRSHEAAISWSKPAAKTVIHHAGLATPDWIALSRSTLRELGSQHIIQEVSTSFGAPCVVKPSSGGSAQGVSLVNTVDELPRALVDAFTYSDIALIERTIYGTELAISVIDSGKGPHALPPVEVVPREGVYSFEARYNAGEATFYTPSRLPKSVLASGIELAIAAYKTLGLRHAARIDTIVDDSGVTWFLEANTIPGTTETSLLPLAIKASGQPEGELYEELVLSAIHSSN